jgi:uracil-DNA glycosylase
MCGVSYLIKMNFSAIQKSPLKGRFIEGVLSYTKRKKCVEKPSNLPRIIAHLKDNIPKGWENVFEEAWDELVVIAKLLDEKSPVFYPKIPDLFRAFELTKLKEVRVVLVGQDPYHSVNSKGVCISHGLAFSVREGEPVPPSLQNIYKEIKNGDPNFIIPSHGNLELWAKREGVLLLNTCLTVVPGKPDSHAKYGIWLPFITKVLNAIAKANPKCIYLLFGRKSQEIKKFIDDKAIILETSHPSPMGVNKGFAGSKIFAKVNQFLKVPINWQL